MSDFGKTFESNASGYDKFRPDYPAAVAQRVAKVSGLTTGARILEIGCGTGKATGLFEEFAPTQTCLDPGEQLLQACKRSYPQFDFFLGKFEHYDSEPEVFDLIYAATSFHWLTKGLRFIKAASLLRKRGHLAVITDQHTKNLGGFFSDVDEIYQRLAPDMYSPFHAQEAETPEENPLELIDQYDVDRELLYSADEYIGLLQTFSGHIALGQDRLRTLCDEVHALIASRYSGQIEKTLTTYTSIYRRA